MRIYSISLPLLAVAAGCAFAPHASAGVLTYTDQAQWAAKVGSYVTETFEASGLQSFTSATGSGFINPARGSALTGSVWAEDSPYEVTFAYKPGPIYAAGAFFDTTPDGQGGGIEVTINLTGGGTEYLGYAIPSTPQFFGWVSDAAVDSWFANGDGETYDVDNLQFGVSEQAPEPASFLLMAAGLAVLSRVRRGQNLSHRSTPMEAEEGRVGG
jgi:hypothetical protein